MPIVIKRNKLFIFLIENNMPTTFAGNLKTKETHLTLMAWRNEIWIYVSAIILQRKNKQDKSPNPQPTHQVFPCSKSTVEILKQVVKSAQC